MSRPIGSPTRRTEPRRPGRWPWHPLAFALALAFGPNDPALAGGVRFDVSDLAATRAFAHPELTGKALAINSVGDVAGYVNYRDPTDNDGHVNDLVDRGFIAAAGHELATPDRPYGYAIDNRVAALSDPLSWGDAWAVGPAPSRYDSENLRNRGMQFAVNRGWPATLYTSNMAYIGAPRGFSPTGISADARLIVGTLTNNQGHSYATAMNYDAAAQAWSWQILSNGPSALRGTAEAVNASRSVTGSGMTAAGTYQAYLYDKDGNLSFLGALGGDHSAGRAISANGIVVGSAAMLGTAAGRDGHPFVFQQGRMVDIDPGTADGTATGVNSAVQVVGRHSSSGSGYSAFLYSPSGGVQEINNYLAAGAATYVAEVAAINESGQMAATGFNNHPLLLTPTGTLSWSALAGGTTGDAGNWDSGLGFTPLPSFNVVINSAASQRIRVDADGFQAKNLLLMGTGGAQVTLDLNHSAVGVGGQGLTIASGGVLTGTGDVAGAIVNRGGTVLASSDGTLRAWDGIQNHGVVTGNGRIFGNLVNHPDGNVHVYAGQTLALDGAFLNHSGAMATVSGGGALRVRDAATNETNAAISIDEGSATFDGGLRNAGWIQIGPKGGVLNGAIVNLAGGRIDVADAATLRVTDALRNDGDLAPGAGSRLLLLGPVTGSGRFGSASGGVVRFEGRFTPDGSAGAVIVGNTEWAGQLVVNALPAAAPVLDFDGSVRFEAGSSFELQVSAAAPFSVGETFHLFRYASAPVGRFGRLQLPSLADGLVWDTSALYSQGALQIAAVPEPAEWAMLLGGLGVVCCWRRRWALDRAEAACSASG